MIYSHVNNSLRGRLHPQHEAVEKMRKIKNIRVSFDLDNGIEVWAENLKKPGTVFLYEACIAKWDRNGWVFTEPTHKTAKRMQERVRKIVNL